MNIRKHFILICVATLLCGTHAKAQEERLGMHSEKRPRSVAMSPEKQARIITDHMDSVLSLTEKRYYRIYQLKLKEARQQAGNSHEGTKRMGGGPGGGGPGRGHGGGPGGRPGFGGNPPSQGDMGHGARDTRQPEKFGQPAPHDAPPASGKIKDMEKQKKKSEKKLKKILTKDQYARWQERIARDKP